MKKFELTGITSVFEGKTLYRIRALKDFPADNPFITKGDLGGWVESELNLSQNGNCWIYDDAKVMDSALVSENAELNFQCIVRGNAKIYGSSILRDNAIIKDYAEVYGNAEVMLNARISDFGKVFGNAIVTDSAEVLNYGKIFGNGSLRDTSLIEGNGRVGGNVFIFGTSRVSGTIYGAIDMMSTTVEENSIIFGYGVFTNCNIRNGAIVHSQAQTFENVNILRRYRSTSSLPFVPT